MTYPLDPRDFLPGNEKLLKDDLSVHHRDKFSQLDSRGWTPLHAAAVQTNQAVLELTLRGVWRVPSVRPPHWPAAASRSVSRRPASGPDPVDCRTPRGQTPLFLAVAEGLLENASFLLKHGAQANSQDQELESPLLTGGEGGTTLCMAVI